MAEQMNPNLLHQHWVHSHEEDTPEKQVFRPANYNFPLSRGRSSFELKPDGGLVESGIGPTDRKQQVEGRWKLEGGDRLALYTDDQARPTRVLKIASANADRLVLETDRS
jgi:hypothetical protein